MKRVLPIIVLLILVAVACETTDSTTDLGAGNPDGMATLSPTPVRSATPSPTPVDLGPPGYNRLTGLWVADPEKLNRRPLLIKVENLPRNHRPQFGLSYADLVYQYYTELGSTRFAALYYGEDAERVGPIRSARLFDIHLVRMYEAVFVFGSAYQDLLDAIFETEFANRLLIEQPGSCPSLCRYNPEGLNFLLADTANLQSYIESLGIDNHRQPLSGMTFDAEAPSGGEAANRIFARFSGAIYNRWDYDPESGGYLRFSETQNDLEYVNEVYEPMVDRLTSEQIRAENVVIVLAEYLTVVKTDTSEIYDIDLQGSGNAYLARDGMIYAAQWRREHPGGVLTLANEDGTPVHFKPGKTWFEVMGETSRVRQTDDVWRFTHYLP